MIDLANFILQERPEMTQNQGFYGPQEGLEL